MTKVIIVIPICNEISILGNAIMNVLPVDSADMIVIDDGSEEAVFTLLDEYPGVKCLRHETPLGYGATVQSGLAYTRDMGYEIAVFVDPHCKNIIDDISGMIQNIEYGYDIVLSSRILENYEYESIPPELLDVSFKLSERVKELTDYDVTDPLSGIMAMKLDSIKEMELTDETHGVLLQLLIQAAYLNLDIIEIPSGSGAPFGRELALYEDSQDMLLAVLEAESYLYKRGTLN